MLKRIQCEAFAAPYQDVYFIDGLNIILGDPIGSSAIGKTTYLDVIDYVFGGDHYYSTDIHEHVGPHTVYFEFEFDGETLYFYRETIKPDVVVSCDDQWRFIEEMEMRHFRRRIAEKYHTLSGNFGFQDVTAHFFRIYGHDNAMEHMPLYSSHRDTDGRAIDFLMNLFGKASILDSLAQKAKELGLSGGQLHKKSDDKAADDEMQMQKNNEDILALEQRYAELMSETEDYQFDYLGFDKEVTAKVRELQQKMQALVFQRDSYQAQIDAINGVRNNNLSGITEEFTSLVRYFPGANIKALSDIEHFHSRIREILSKEAMEQISGIQKQIDACNFQIQRLRDRIKEVGITRKMATGAVTQGVEIQMQIEHLKTENEEIQQRIDDRLARREAEQELSELIRRQKEAIQTVQDSINETMRILSDAITGGREPYAPLLTINEDKTASFETPGNTSEGSAFKGLIIYDLAVMRLCPERIPALIHDSNILSRVETEYLGPILQQYINCGHQVFIAFEKPESAEAKAKEILLQHTRLELGSGNGKELYGRSWSKREKEKQKSTAPTESENPSEGENDHGSNT